SRDVFLKRLNGGARGESGPGNTRPRRGTPLLVDVDVNQQPVPERLQHVEDKTLFAVEESQTKNVPVDEVARRPPVSRRLRPQLLEKRHPLVRIAEQPAFHAAPLATQLFARLEPGVP